VIENNHSKATLSIN